MFASLPKYERQKPTYLGISRYPHYENVISNILEFFLNTNECHGFGDLMIKSLLSNILPDEGLDYPIETEWIEREVSTSKSKKAKKIDLLMETQDFIVCIENKIYAGLYNNLTEYSRYADSLSGNKQTYKIVLSLFPVPTKLLTDGFQNITYRTLFENLEVRLGSYLSNEVSSYLPMLMDFRSEFKLKYGGKVMDEKTRKFYAEHWTQLSEMNKSYNDIKSDIRKEVELINNALLERINNVMQNIKYKQWWHVKTTLVVDLTLADGVMFSIDFWPELDEPFLKFFIRHGHSIEKMDFMKRAAVECINKIADELNHNIEEYKTNF